MSSGKRWVQVGQGEFFKWTDEGQTLEGIWRGQRDGQYGPIGMLDAERGRVSFPLHTALLDRVRDIPEGTEIQIIYMGMRPTKAGKTFKMFNVGVAEPEHPGDREHIGTPPEDDVPF